MISRQLFTFLGVRDQDDGATGNIHSIILIYIYTGIRGIAGYCNGTRKAGDLGLTPSEC